MTASLRRLRSTIEAHPLVSLCVLWMLVSPLAGGLAALQAGSWRRQHVSAALRTNAAVLDTDTRVVAEKVALTFRNLREVSVLLATAPYVAAALRDPADLPAVSRRYQAVGRTLHLHRVLLMDRRGVCVATNETDPLRNLLGVSLADREYVSNSLAGRLFTQLVVGRVSSVPGFHVSAPVRAGGGVIGALAVKMDLQTLSREVLMRSGVVADAMGVVVIASDPARLLQAVPGSPALALGEAECRRRYKRPRLEPMPMAPVSVDGRRAFRIAGMDGPVLVRTARVAGEDLVVYGFSSVGDLLDEAEARYQQHFLWNFWSLDLLFGLLLASVVHFLRDGRQRRELRALNRELAEQARRDPLTGCSNRRPFDDMLERETLRSTRTGAPFTLAYADLDRFKEVNDTHGHAVGDAVLVHVAGVMRASLRGVDDIARLGGDEFALLLPGADEEAAEEALRRVVARLEALPAQTDAGPLAQTVSVGAAVSRGEMTPAGLKRAADEALYASKKAGRNQVVVRGPSAAAPAPRDRPAG